ncbi:MAG: hypothetical protein JWP37_1251 [Mucilaginibacter sp.]|nr:hypothetical protein [Mucilaginibacter sp.]
MIVVVANTLYKEHYSAMPMRHSINKLPGDQTQYLYEWKFDGQWNNRIGGTVANELSPIVPGSKEEFIFEHYWGYNKASKKTTFEYQVEHISWKVGQVINPVFEAEIGRLYGKKFEPYLKKKPYSAFFADGSEVTVRGAGKIRV